MSITPIVNSDQVFDSPVVLLFLWLFPRNSVSIGNLLVRPRNVILVGNFPYCLSRKAAFSLTHYHLIREFIRVGDL